MLVYSGKQIKSIKDLLNRTGVTEHWVKRTKAVGGTRLTGSKWTRTQSGLQEARLLLGPFHVSLIPSFGFDLGQWRVADSPSMSRKRRKSGLKDPEGPLSAEPTVKLSLSRKSLNNQETGKSQTGREERYRGFQLRPDKKSCFICCSYTTIGLNGFRETRQADFCGRTATPAGNAHCKKSTQGLSR